MINIMSRLSKVILLTGLIMGSLVGYGQCVYNTSQTITSVSACAGEIEVSSNATLVIDLNGAVDNTLHDVLLKDNANIEFISGVFQQNITVTDESNNANTVNFNQSGSFASDVLTFGTLEVTYNNAQNTNVILNGVVTGNLDLKLNTNSKAQNSVSIGTAEVYGNLDLENSEDLDISTLSVFGNVDFTSVKSDVVDSLYVKHNLDLINSEIIFKGGSRSQVDGNLDVSLASGTAFIQVDAGAYLNVKGNLESGANISFDVTGQMDIKQLWSTLGKVTINEGAVVHTDRHQHSNSDFRLDGGQFMINDVFQPTGGNVKLVDGTLFADTINLLIGMEVYDANLFSQILIAGSGVNFNGTDGCFGFNVCALDTNNAMANVEVFCNDELVGTETKPVCYDCNKGCTSSVTQLDNGTSVILYNCNSCVYYYTPSSQKYLIIKDGTIFNPDVDITGKNATEVTTADNNCSGFVKNARVCSQIDPLPVELSYFTVAEYGNSSARLSWVTSSEKNNDYFIIYRSTDAENFEYVDVVDGSGNSSSAVMYEYIDDGINTGGYVYYQLVQVDFDGTRSGSNVKSLMMGNADFGVYPTKLASGGSVSISGIPAETPYIVAITDVKGSSVVYRRFKATGGTMQLPIKQLPGGYILSLVLPDGIKSFPLIVE